MEAIVQHFIGTTHEWMSANPLLYEAVWGIEAEPSGRRLLKIGDGIHYWQELPYVDETYIKGLPEKLTGLIQQGDSLVNAVRALEEALEAERVARANGDDTLQVSMREALTAENEARVKGDNALQVSIGVQVQSEATLRIQADNTLRLWAETELQKEWAARESLQVLTGQLLEFIREQMGPFDPVELFTGNGFNVATYDGKTIVTLLDINHII
jgi:hypothetical protein